CIQTLEFPWTF
nr:immunoglobulin light chain junction region [Macaca mulatta]MOX84505.1 immunoglobulin light chain junction region [Macaca mulatta]MOX84515.1 immunoglobulin light chain junction region [Macaca mulatta]MOX84571.1 immunoglobulin light chain junction region [Macaca mulatta]MOX84593.1 immunoglobulin light chain junction region [Macaca mulatta]